MSEPKFTPGPWLLRKVDNQEWHIDVKSSGLHDGFPWDGLAVAYGYDDKPSEGKVIARANAALIAAAPQLYAALDEAADLLYAALKCIDDPNYPVAEERGAILIWRDLLRRARGE